MAITNHYPLLTWTFDVSGTADIQGPGGTDSGRSVDATGQVAWEPQTIGGQTSMADTLTAAINAGFGTHGMSPDGTVWHVDPFTVGLVDYSVPFPRVQYNIDAGSVTAVPPRITFSSLAVAAQYGFSTTIVDAVSVSGAPSTDSWAFITDAIPDGLLSFGVVGRRWDPDVGYNASRLRSPFDPGSWTTVQHSSITSYTIEWLNASARFIDNVRAAIEVYAQDAGCSVNDTNGTLETFLDADQDDDVDVYLWLTSTDVSLVSLLWDRNPTTQDFVSPGSLGARRFNITLSVVEYT